MARVQLKCQLSSEKLNLSGPARIRQEFVSKSSNRFKLPRLLMQDRGKDKLAQQMLSWFHS